jgi:acyl-CoA dehydrogenase
MDNLFAQALDDVLSDQCTPAVVRELEAQPKRRELWQTLVQQGLADALLPEADGGADVSLEQAFDLWQLCARYSLPLPLPETMWARAVLHAQGIQAPPGPIGLGLGMVPKAGVEPLVVDVSAGRACDHVLVQGFEGLVLLSVASAEVTPHGLAMDARMTWSPQAVQAGTRLPPSQGATSDLKTVQALLAAVQLSGAMMVVFEQSLEHANQRQQFGKPIGKFQAIQHNLSLMAEQVFASRMAAQLACTGTWRDIQAVRVAVAKARTSQAAQQVTTLAHGLHGAMGFTSEFDLQLRTRRIYAWRQCAGAETHWQKALGESLLQHPKHSLDVLLELTALPH